MKRVRAGSAVVLGLALALTGCIDSRRDAVIEWARQISALETRLEREVAYAAPFYDLMQEVPLDGWNLTEFKAYRRAVSDIYADSLAVEPPEQAYAVHQQFVRSYERAAESIRYLILSNEQRDPDDWTRSFELWDESRSAHEIAIDDLDELLREYAIACSEIDFCVTTRAFPTAELVAPAGQSGSVAGCLPVEQITAQMAGQELCVYGTVLRVQEYYGATQLRFGGMDEFFFSSGSIYYPDIGAGDCVYAIGPVLLSAERVPYINIEEALYLCESWMDG